MSSVEPEFTKVWTAYQLKCLLENRSEDELKRIFIKFDVPSVNEDEYVDDGRGIEVTIEDRYLKFTVDIFKKPK